MAVGLPRAVAAARKNGGAGTAGRGTNTGGQRGTNSCPGTNVGVGKDPALFALTAGRVAFRGGKLGRKFVCVDMPAIAAE